MRYPDMPGEEAKRGAAAAQRYAARCSSPWQTRAPLVHRVKPWLLHSSALANP